MDFQDTDGRSFGISAGHGMTAHVRQVSFFKALYENYSDIITIDEELHEILYPWDVTL